MLGEIYHFWNKGAFFRWFHVVPGVFGSFMSTSFIEPSWFSFSDFEPACKINHFLNENAFFGWFHVVPGVFSSCMLTCYMEPSWFPFSSFRPLIEIYHFCGKNAFFQLVPCGSQCFRLY